MARLTDLLGVLDGVKKTAKKAIDDTYHTFQKPNLFGGFTKTYRPKDEEGDKLPDENQLVQYSVTTMLADLVPAWARLIDVQASVDTTNGEAKASIDWDGYTSGLLPATTLLWLEKNLVDLRTLIAKAPLLDPAKAWELDENLGLYATKPRDTLKTKKVLQNHVKAAATDKHPAQVDVYTADVTVGYWTGVDLSGAIPATRQRELLARIDSLLEAVKLARNEANRAEVQDVRVGTDLLAKLLG